MGRQELDLEKSIWTIPSARTKNRRANEVPLSQLAMDVLAIDNHLLSTSQSHSSWCGLKGAGQCKWVSANISIARCTASTTIWFAFEKRSHSLKTRCHHISSISIISPQTVELSSSFIRLGVDLRRAELLAVT